MLRIPCPHCGLRDYVEFAYGDDSALRFPELSECDIDRWTDAVFVRDNPRGEQRELWQHQHGCRQWLCVVRDAVTHEIKSVVPARALRGSGAAAGGESG